MHSYLHNIKGHNAFKTVPIEMKSTSNILLI
uniref:Uncharacterized protein n=1 Tax=Arundo donax TaxID=35708 RepID=A0A0A8Z2J4_ARUDO